MAQNVIFMVFDVFDLDLDSSRSFDFCCVHHMPLHDWCDFRRDMFIISGDIAHWNMDKFPIFYNRIFRFHGNVRYVLVIDTIFCNVHSIGQSNMCINFEKNRLRIDDFKKSEKIVCFLWRHVAQKRDVVCQNRVPLAEAPFYKERFPTNQKSLRLPVQKLWPIMWFLQKWWPWPWP